MAQLRSSSLTSGAIRLCQDIATLINNSDSGDVQFNVGGESTNMTIYAHSPILRCRSRYFTGLLDDNKSWKEGSKYIIYKPDISSSTFQDVLYYIYTGNVRAKSSENIVQLITAAEEMDLEELSIGCQTELLRIIKYSLSSKENDHDNKHGETFDGSRDVRFPVDVVVRTFIIPALNLAYVHVLSDFLQELLTLTLRYMSTIIVSPNARSAFVNGISSQTLLQILSSDNLALKERKSWDLTLDWACKQKKLLRTAVEARLRIIDSNKNEKKIDEGEKHTTSTDHQLVTDAQLRDLKAILEPVLPAIRFSLFEPEDYTETASILNYLLSSRQSLELQRFFATSDTSPWDRLRRYDTNDGISSKIATRSALWKLLKKHIFETGAITGCLSPDDLEFNLLFRTSDHGFLSFTFHQRCDNKGPTITLVKSTDGHLFGGVNFASWNLNGNSSSPQNFLFALADGHHRKDSAIFRLKDQNSVQYSAAGDPNYGPCFGRGSDISIANSADITQSYSNLDSYRSSGTSNTSLAGSVNFTLSDYEVFAISKRL